MPFANVNGVMVEIPMLDESGAPVQVGMTYINGRPVVQSAAEQAQNRTNAIQDAAAARQAEWNAAAAADPRLKAYLDKGYDLNSARILLGQGLSSAGYTDPGNRAIIQKEADIALAATGNATPWSPGTFEVSRGETVLPTPAPRREIMVINDPAPAATPWVQTDSPPALKEGAGMSLGTIVGNAAKGVLQSLPGGSLLTAGAMALLNSRRDSPPQAVAGMPSLPPLTNPVGSFQWGVQTATSAGQNALQYIGQQVGILPAGGGGLGAVAPRSKSVTTLRCPKGYALAIDGKCYPKSMLPRQMRKWKPDPKPVVSRSDQKAIRRSAAAKKRLVKITKDSGAYASLHKPHHEPAGRKKR